MLFAQQRPATAAAAAAAEFHRSSRVNFLQPAGQVSYSRRSPVAASPIGAQKRAREPASPRKQPASSSSRRDRLATELPSGSRPIFAGARRRLRPARLGVGAQKAGAGETKDERRTTNEERLQAK